MLTLAMFMQMDWESLGRALLATVIFGLVGIGLMILGYKIFDWITPGVDFGRELTEKHNVAVAIVVGAIVLGVALIVHAAMS